MANTVADIETFLTYLLDRLTLKDPDELDHLKAVLGGTEDLKPPAPAPDTTTTTTAPEGSNDGSSNVPGTDTTGAGATGGTPRSSEPAGANQPAAENGETESLSSAAGADTAPSAG